MFEQLKAIISEKFKLDPDGVAPRSTLADLELDSLDLVELSLVIEKELGARVSDTELADLQQLDAIVELLESRHASAGWSPTLWSLGWAWYVPLGSEPPKHGSGSAPESPPPPWTRRWPETRSRSPAGCRALTRPPCWADEALDGTTGSSNWR